MRRHLIFPALTLLALTGCSSVPSGQTDAPKESYATVSALKDAFVAAGGNCPGWVQSNKVEVAAQSGECGDGPVLSIYTSDSARDQIVAFGKTSPFGGDQLVGKNWIINTDHPDRYVKALGGTIVSQTK